MKKVEDGSPVLENGETSVPKVAGLSWEDMEQIDSRTEQGAWVDNIRNLPGVALRVRGDGNVDYDTLHLKMIMDMPLEKRADPATADEIDKKLIRETILLDWKGFGFPFTPENVKRALEMRTFRQGCVIASRLVATRGRESLEADVGN